MLEEICRSSSTEFECKRDEALIKDGIEDWLDYLDGLESKVAIEYMDSNSEKVKVFLNLHDLSPCFLFPNFPLTYLQARN